MEQEGITIETDGCSPWMPERTWVVINAEHRAVALKITGYLGMSLSESAEHGVNMPPLPSINTEESAFG